MTIVKTHCQYGYSLLGEKPSQLDNTAQYVVIGESKHFPYCVIIQRADGRSFQGKKVWIVPETSIY